MAIFESAENLRQENLALRMVLRRQGLSDSTIQRRVNAYRKARKEEDSALLLLRQCCEDMLKRWPEIDLEEELATLPIKGKPQ
jgi:hypothetical protein